jgi:hypothetical protein
MKAHLKREGGIPVEGSEEGTQGEGGKLKAVVGLLGEESREEEREPSEEDRHLEGDDWVGAGWGVEDSLVGGLQGRGRRFTYTHGCLHEVEWNEKKSVLRIRCDSGE